MTREQGNNEKRRLIERVQAGQFDGDTMRLLFMFCRKIKQVDKLRTLDRSLSIGARYNLCECAGAIGAAAVKQMEQERKATREYITANIEKWVKADG